MIMYLTAFALALIIGIVFLKTPANVLAGFLKTIVPLAMIGIGALLIFAKQAAIGALLVFAGISLWRRFRTQGGGGPPRGKFPGGKPSPGGMGISSVRSAAFEMELDKDDVALNGVILVGSYEGRILDELSLPDLLNVRGEVLEDEDSLVLLDTYLDRRFSGWRENA